MVEVYYVEVDDSTARSSSDSTSALSCSSGKSGIGLRNSETKRLVFPECTSLKSGKSELVPRKLRCLDILTLAFTVARHSDPKRFSAERQKLFLSVQPLELNAGVFASIQLEQSDGINAFDGLRKIVLPKYGFEGGPKAVLALQALVVFCKDFAGHRESLTCCSSLISQSLLRTAPSCNRRRCRVFYNVLHCMVYRYIDIHSIHMYTANLYT